MFFVRSLVPRPVRAIRETRGGLEPSAIARGLKVAGLDFFREIPPKFEH